MWEFTRHMGLTVLDTSGHQFSPQGATRLFLLSESHVSCHTWPEHASCIIDVFCCSKDFDPGRAEYLLAKLFQTRTVKTRLISRHKTGVANVQDHVEVGPRVDTVRFGRGLSVSAVQEDRRDRQLVERLLGIQERLNRTELEWRLWYQNRPDGPLDR